MTLIKPILLRFFAIFFRSVICSYNRSLSSYFIIPFSSLVCLPDTAQALLRRSSNCSFFFFFFCTLYNRPSVWYNIIACVYACVLAPHVVRTWFPLRVELLFHHWKVITHRRTHMICARHLNTGVCKNGGTSAGQAEQQWRKIEHSSQHHAFISTIYCGTSPSKPYNWHLERAISIDFAWESTLLPLQPKTCEIRVSCGPSWFWVVAAPAVIGCERICFVRVCWTSITTSYTFCSTFFFTL